MFERFASVVYGKSPISGCAGIWGLYEGQWYLLNGFVAVADVSMPIRPNHFVFPPLLERLLRCPFLEKHMIKLLEFAQASFAWRTFSVVDINLDREVLDFLVDAGWLVKQQPGQYDYTKGLIGFLATAPMNTTLVG